MCDECEIIAREIQEIVNVLPVCTVYNTYTLFKNNLPGLKFPWKEEDTTCVTICLTAFDTGAAILTPLAISAAGMGAAVVLAGSLVCVTSVGSPGKMILCSTFVPLCLAICSEEKQGISTKSYDSIDINMM